MNMKYTDSDLISSAKRFTLLSEWRKAEKRHYGQAWRRGLIDQIKSFMVVQTTGSKHTYTEQELIADSKNYDTMAEWKSAGQREMLAGKVSHYHCAMRYPDFFKKHCQRMEVHHRWTDAELIEAASSYSHKGDWKRSTDRLHAAAYQSASARPEVFARATAHMSPKASPFAGSYVVYVYEFVDHHAYVGLTFLPKERHSQHMVRGPVFDHLSTIQKRSAAGDPPQFVVPQFSMKMLESGINDPATVAEAEKRWIKKYEDDGWQMLNISSGGGLGTIQRVREWTKELVLSEALKFKTKQDWIDSSQGSYRIAKREGWFDEASAHMPKRNATHLIGRAVSDETRQKQAAAKLGRVQDPVAAAARIAASTAARAANRNALLARMRADPSLSTTSPDVLMARYGVSRPTLAKYLKLLSLNTAT